MSLYKGAVSIPTATQADQITELHWTRGGGESLQKFIEGKWSKVYSDLQFAKADWDSAVITRKGDWWRLELSQNGDTLTDIHEIQGSNLMQSKVYNTVLKAQFTALAMDESHISRIAAEVQKYKTGAQSYAEMASAVATIGNNNAVAFDLMDDLDRNGDQFLQVQYCYRHSVIMSERFFNSNSETFWGIYDNVSRIFTEDALYDVEVIPEEFALPQRVLDGDPAEWLKQPPHANHTSGQRRELVNEYIFADEWSRLYYAEAEL